MEHIEVTHLYCPASGGPEGGDNTTHHLVPRGPQAARQQVCTYCGESEKTLREAARSSAG